MTVRALLLAALAHLSRRCARAGERCENHFRCDGARELVPLRRERAQDGRRSHRQWQRVPRGFQGGRQRSPQQCVLQRSSLLCFHLRAWFALVIYLGPTAITVGSGQMFADLPSAIATVTKKLMFQPVSINVRFRHRVLVLCFTLLCAYADRLW